MNRPVDTLKPIRPILQTGICSRCGYPVTDPCRAVELTNGALAHRHHFHSKDIADDWAWGGDWESSSDAYRSARIDGTD